MARMPRAVSMATAGVLGIFGGEVLCILGPLEYERQVHLVCHVILYGGVLCVAAAAVLRWGLERMTPRDLVRQWVEAFNRGDSDALASFYADDAVNHQVAESPVHGRDAIKAMFEQGFASATMVCVVENIFEDGEWAILEWKDPLGLRGCGFFHVQEGRIVFQRGYWDKLTFLRVQGLPLPRE